MRATLVLNQILRFAPAALAAGGVALGFDGAFAVEPNGEAGGLPQLNPATFPTQLFWGAVAFITLYWLMSRKALPRVGAVLEERAERIGEDLDKAAQFRSEADAAQAEYEKALAQSRAEAQAILREMEASLAQANANAQAALAAEVTEQGRAAEQRITAAKEAALGNLRVIALDVAEAVASRLTGHAAAQGRVENAVDAAIQERR